MGRYDGGIKVGFDLLLVAVFSQRDERPWHYLAHAGLNDRLVSLPPDAVTDGH